MAMIAERIVTSIGDRDNALSAWFHNPGVNPKVNPCAECPNAKPVLGCIEPGENKKGMSRTGLICNFKNAPVTIEVMELVR